MSALKKFESLYEGKFNELLEKYEDLHKKLDNIFKLPQLFKTRSDDGGIESIKELCSKLIEQLISKHMTISEIAMIVDWEKDLIIELNEKLIYMDDSDDEYE